MQLESEMSICTTKSKNGDNKNVSLLNNINKYLGICKYRCCIIKVEYVFFIYKFFKLFKIMYVFH